MRRACAVVAFLVATFFISVMFAPSAFAHATLSSSDPADGDRLDSPPDQVQLTFSEPVGLSNGYLRVTDENGERVDDATPKAEGNRVAVGLRAGVTNGSFLISYRLISADSHPSAGALAFVVGDGPLTAATDAEQASISDPVVGVVFSVVRWLSYAGLVVLVGPLVIAGLGGPAVAAAPVVGRLFRIGAVVSIGAALLSVIVQGLYVSGAPLTRLLSIDVPAILGTTYGIAMLVRVTLVAFLALLVGRVFFPQPGDASDPEDAVDPVDLDERRPVAPAPALWWATGGLLIGIALTHSFSGHPIASTIPVLSVVSDVIHVLSMSVWLGGLVVLVVGLLPQRDAGLLAEVLPRFSSLAMVSIGALLISGSVQAVLEISPLAALWSTSYGLLVTFKVIGLAVIVGLGNVSRTWVRARYSGRADGPDTRQADRPPQDATGDPVQDLPGVRLVPAVSDVGAPGGLAQAERRRMGLARPSFEALRRTLLFEIGVAATVLALAAVLVATVPARSAFAAPFAASLALPDGGSVELTVEPARSGPNLMHVSVLDEAGQPLDTQEVSATAELRAEQIGPLDIPLQPTGHGHFTAPNVSLPVAGLWLLTLDIRFGEFDAASVAAEVPVS